MSQFISHLALTVPVLSQAESGPDWHLTWTFTSFIYKSHVTIWKWSRKTRRRLWQSGHGSRCQGVNVLWFSAILLYQPLPVKELVRRRRRSWHIVPLKLCRILPAKNPLCLQPDSSARSSLANTLKEREEDTPPSQSVCLDVRTWRSVYVGDADWKKKERRRQSALSRCLSNNSSYLGSTAVFLFINRATDWNHWGLDNCLVCVCGQSRRIKGQISECQRVLVVPNKKNCYRLLLFSLSETSRLGMNRCGGGRSFKQSR